MLLPIMRIVTIGAALALVAGAFFGFIRLQAWAQGDSPTMTPIAPTVEQAGVPGSDVVWTVGAQTFESRYPAGFQFTAEVSSSAGPVVRGRVIWSHVPGRQRSRPAEIDPATGQLSAEWQATGADAVPPWVGVTYYWDISDSAGNNFQTEPQYAEYEDNTYTWVRTESDDIIVFTQDLPDQVREMTVEAMAQQRETYRGAWGALLPYKPRAILFGSRAAWVEWQITTVSPGTIGLTFDDWGGTVQVVSGGDLVDLAYGTVPHEIAHLYQSEFTIMVAGTWLVEGDATFFELNRQYDYEGSVRALAASGKLPPLLQGTGPGVSGANARRGYDIGYTFIKWLVDNYGLDGHRQLIELLDQGIERNRALESVTGLPVEEIESRWRVWLGASPVAPTLVPTPTFFFPLGTPFIE